MNAEEFARLPLLLSRKQVRMVLGVTSRSVSELVALDSLTPVVIHRSHKAKYRKTEVAELLGLTLDGKKVGA